jgi:hypothetical protein
MATVLFAGSVSMTKAEIAEMLELLASILEKLEHIEKLVAGVIKPSEAATIVEWAEPER